MMKQVTFDVRPAQAKALIGLQAKVVEAEDRLNLAMGVLLAGLCPEGSEVTDVATEGKVVVRVEEVEE